MEQWKEIEGFEGYYEISNNARVKSVERRIGNRIFKGKILSQDLTKNGYKQVNLYKNSKRSHFYVHRLVAYHFILNNDDDKKVVNHKNGIKTDNRIENLEWNTSSENNIHAKDIGLNLNHGTKSSNSKLTEIQLSEIRIHLDLGIISQTEIAKKYNISNSTVSEIKHGKKYKRTYKNNEQWI